MAFVHKSSIAVHKSRLAQKKLEEPLDVGIQTELDHNHLHHLGLSVLPPDQNKAELLDNDPYFFVTVDDHVTEVSRKWYKSIRKLVKHLREIIDDVPEYQEREELVTVRAIFVWICSNLRYDPAFLEHQLTTLDILRYRAGVCREFVKIFVEMCQIVNIPVKSIEGFAKGPDYKPGEVVRVHRDFMSGEERGILLRVEDYGIVENLDEDGDAQVRFPGLRKVVNKHRWVLKPCFEKLSRACQ